ncbi:MAG: type II toxin-antitoxin system VapC family toxin [Acidobacteriota bacterium]
MKIDEALQGVSRLAFDTSPIIYFVEANPAYDKLVSNIFNRVAAGELEGWTSVISLSEVLVQPLVSGRKDLREAYRELLLGSSNFNTLPIDATIAENAARMRASYGLRLPDAIQIAFAIDTGCEAILCNDHSMRRVTELLVLILDDLEL